MIVVVRLDLDSYSLEAIEKLYIGNIITLDEACTSKHVRAMNDLQRLMWVRKVKQVHSLKQAV